MRHMVAFFEVAGPAKYLGGIMIKSEAELELDDVYRAYGFKRQWCSQKGIAVYVFRSGYFHNADIVRLNDDSDISGIVKDYENGGYSTAIRNFRSIHDTSKLLFDGFFNVKEQRAYNENEVSKFRNRLSKNIAGEYGYIEGKFNSTAERLEASVVEHIISLIGQPGPALIILEAAAGYGKTCTAFELLRSVSGICNDRLPILAELSRNRQARVFKYVLLDELDRRFGGISYELASREIASGRLLLIVDGFDELLHSARESSDLYEETEPMLQTIAELLTGDAKIILTSRRTILFAGEQFSEWVEKHADSFSAHRISLEKPTIDDWLGGGRSRKLLDAQIPMHELANPVLLTYLRNLSDDQFDEVMLTGNQIAEKYLESLLARERERQNLMMSVQEQKTVFMCLVDEMVRDDFTSEESDYIQLRIKERCSELIAQVRLRYLGDIPPTEDELIKKLATHALLDRKDEERNLVGFVNDFVLGTLAGEQIISTSQSGEILYPERFVDASATAFAMRQASHRNRLFGAVRFSLECGPANWRLQAEFCLLLSNELSYDGQTFWGLQLAERVLGKNGRIINSVFHHCTFKRCTLELTGMEGCSFIDCSFFDCVFESAGHADVGFFACHANAELPVKLSISNDDVIDIDATNPEVNVLEQYWPRGRPGATKRKAIRTLFRGLDSRHGAEVWDAIEKLRRQGILVLVGDHAELQMDKMSVVREMLGR